MLGLWVEAHGIFGCAASFSGRGEAGEADE